MNIAEDTNYAGSFIVKEYQPGRFIRINLQKYTTSLIITAKEVVTWNHPDLDRLSEHDLAPIFKHSPELILWGSGAEFCMPPAIVREQCVRQGRVLEPMNTRAAGGTFNMLLTDDRPVIAVLQL